VSLAPIQRLLNPPPQFEGDLSTQQAAPFEVAQLRAGDGRGGGGHGGDAGWRDNAFPAMPATSYAGSPAFAGKDDIKRMRSVMTKLDAMRTGATPMTEDVAAVLRCCGAAVLRDNGLSKEECVEMMQSMIEDALGLRATSLAAAMRQAIKGNGSTDYVEAIKIMAAHKSL